MITGQEQAQWFGLAALLVHDAAVQSKPQGQEQDGAPTLGRDRGCFVPLSENRFYQIFKVRWELISHGSGYSNGLERVNCAGFFAAA